MRKIKAGDYYESILLLSNYEESLLVAVES
jgi:hypothetical protein